MTLTWHVVHTNANAELAAAHALSGLGYQVVYPHKHGVARHARRIRAVVRPYFWRYLFLGRRFDQGLMAVEDQPNVSSVLHVADRVAEMAASEVRQWQTDPAVPDCDSAGCLGYDRSVGRPREARDRYAHGTEVEIIDGPLMGKTGRVWVDKGHTVRVFVDRLFGITVEVAIEPSALAPLHPSGPAHFSEHHHG